MVGIKRRYAFHMKDGLPTIEGLLVKRTRRGFLLVKAEILEAADRTHDLGGHVEVLRENVFCLQELE